MTYCDKRNQREKISTSQTHTDTTNKIIKLNRYATFFGLVKNNKIKCVSIFLYTQNRSSLNCPWNSPMDIFLNIHTIKKIKKNGSSSPDPTTNFQIPIVFDEHPKFVQKIVKIWIRSFEICCWIRLARYIGVIVKVVKWSEF